MTTPAPRRRTDRAAPPAHPGERVALMDARAGDGIVVRGTTAGAVTRYGEVVGVHHADVSPPYDVRPSDDGRVILYFPGPGAFVRHLVHEPEPVDAAAHVPSATAGPEAGGDRVLAQ
ncbi:DUF1918 domain-containing protein [Streptomyces sp. NPDC059680]|uniref:DUF1918 domain-containing protein n=1 Tax=Streptomyces sp. NPDC059680 TaxID=3346904 RepID=UPI0036CFD9FD